MHSSCEKCKIYSYAIGRGNLIYGRFGVASYRFGFDELKQTSDISCPVRAVARAEEEKIWPCCFVAAFRIFLEERRSWLLLRLGFRKRQCLLPDVGHVLAVARRWRDDSLGLVSVDDVR